MDDALSLPSSTPLDPSANNARDQDADDGSHPLSSDSEDEAPDWSKLLRLNKGRKSAAQVVVPKRGAKEYEPSGSGSGTGTRLQEKVLENARDAMYEALRGERSITNKAVSYATWHPTLARAHVTLQRGVLFNSIGHSVPRPSPSPTDPSKLQKRLELLPEEAIYLIERGNLYCTTSYNDDEGETGEEEETRRPPMSAQQAFTSMIGCEGITLERYQVYAYLKRLGYTVTRTVPPDAFYPVSPPHSSLLPTGLGAPNLFRWIWAFLTSLTRPTTKTKIDWWHPLLPALSNSCTTYASIFALLRSIFPPLFSHPPPSHVPDPGKESPYTSPFFNIYKPGNTYKKTSPGQPDYQICVVDARTTRMPSLSELTSLFSKLPPAGPPVPRKRGPPYSTSSTSAPNPPSVTKPVPPPKHSSLLSHILPWSPRMKPKPKPTNPFPLLKQGRKIAIVAVVDCGSIGFYWFGEGVFDEWPML